MGLSATFNIAQSALATNANLTSIVSRNIAGVNDTSYTRKIGNVSTVADGTGQLVSIGQANDTALFGNLLTSTAQSASSTALADGLDKLEQTIGLSTSSTSSTDTTTTGNSPATLIGALSDALGQYAASPSDANLGQAVITSASSLSSALNSAAATVQSVRAQADAGIADAVKDVNSLLSQFQSVNTAIVKGTALGTDTTDAVDQRNKILLSLSSDLGISTTTNADGGMSIYTDSGVTLFQGTPRSVTFTPTTSYAAGTVGGAVTIDGVPVTGSGSVMTLKSGTIAGLSTLRDTTTVAYQNQLDQIAGGLISAFSESDQTGGSAPTIPGLFTYAGAPAMPTTGQTGLAASIAVNANVDPSQGGTLTRLRDGGIGDPSNSAYTANTTGAASYSSHLTALSTALSGSQTFDASTGGLGQGSVAAYATSSVSWLEAARQTASTEATSRSAVASATATSLSSSTGVNLDEQLSQMLDLEHSYQASAELLSTVKGLYQSLFAAI